MPEKVGVRELKQRGSEILRQVREEGAEYDVTYHGRVVAHLIPASTTAPTESDLDELWADLDHLAAEIDARWPDDETAADAVSDDRREL